MKPFRELPIGPAQRKPKVKQDKPRYGTKFQRILDSLEGWGWFRIGEYPYYTSSIARTLRRQYTDFEFQSGYDEENKIYCIWARRKRGKHE